MRCATVEVQCSNKRCKVPFIARVADRKRGWGRFCSKACKAVEQEKRTGQFAGMIHRPAHRFSGNSGFADAHLFSNEEHDCNKD